MKSVQEKLVALEQKWRPLLPPTPEALVALTGLSKDEWAEYVGMLTAVTVSGIFLGMILQAEAQSRGRAN